MSNFYDYYAANRDLKIAPTSNNVRIPNTQKTGKKFPALSSSLSY